MPFANSSHSAYQGAWNGTTALMWTALSRLAATSAGSAPHERREAATTGSFSMPRCPQVSVPLDTHCLGVT